VDNIFDCKPVEVCDCGARLQVLADEPVRHQVFDVPPVKAQVDEYRRYSGRCLGCGKAHRAALPAGVPSGQIGPRACRVGKSARGRAEKADRPAGVPSGQIGPRALALIGTLGTHHHLTQFKKQLLRSIAVIAPLRPEYIRSLSYAPPLRIQFFSAVCQINMMR